MRTLFTRLAILPKGEEEDSNNTMDELINYCWNWVEKAYPSIDINKNKIGYQKLKANSSIIIENKSLDGVRFWKMVRSEEGGKDIGTEFKNYIFIAKDGDWIEFSLLQSVVHPVNRITPHEIPIYPPWLLNKIIDSFDCRVGEDIISSDWTTIVPENIEYLRKKIINSDRRVPIIVLSKKWATRKSIIQKPGILSNKLSSLAEIYILSDPNTKQLGKPFGQQWLSNGTIRIFWPGVTSELLSFDPAWNNMYSQKRLDGEFNGNEGELIQDIINKVCLATMSQQASSDFVKNIREKIERNELELELEKNNSERELILTEISSSTEKISYLENELKILNDKVSINDIEFNKTTIKLEVRNEKIDSLMHQINTLNDENTSYKALIRVIEEAKRRNPDGTKEDFMSFIDGYGVEEEEEGPEPEQKFGSIIEALEEAKNSFSRIKILETAFDSAKKTNAEIDPAEVYQILSMLNDTVWPEIKKDIDKKSKRRINVHGLMKDTFSDKKYSPDESSITMNKYKKEDNYKARFFPLSNNKKIRIKPHLRFGTKSNPLRIHLVCLHDKSSYEVIESYINNKNKKIKKYIKNEFNNFPKIIIGWCGDHIPL